jgi:hypothetical protein
MQTWILSLPSVLTSQASSNNVRLLALGFAGVKPPPGDTRKAHFDSELFYILNTAIGLLNAQAQMLGWAVVDVG